MPADGSDFGLTSWGAFEDMNELKNHFSAAAAPGSPATGVIHHDTSPDELNFWNGSAWEAFVESDNYGLLPAGSIIQWLGGYFTDGANAGYTRMLGTDNNIAAVNALYNGQGWYVCNGAALNDSDSPIFNGAGRYLPNITDDRFIQGDTVAGGTGGSSTQAHTHGFNIPLDQSSTESNTFDVDDLSPTEGTADFTHVHDVDYINKTSEAATNDENRPAYLAGFYLMRTR